ncbi:hypothetical protein Tdes44962_MAKER09601 [Teratosphaeria destructans]|uniref:Uncharacterized protein n=1 Tax=Teratosphaeria destructans TaxID=418781 RepID=A0A9W7W2G1_9PEZI|nr:hypothetical protein Tdes44962_MAKER09601 [Teratosphaeria destructans]
MNTLPTEPKQLSPRSLSRVPLQAPQADCVAAGLLLPALSVQRQVLPSAETAATRLATRTAVESLISLSWGLFRGLWRFVVGELGGLGLWWFWERLCGRGGGLLYMSLWRGGPSEEGGVHSLLWTPPPRDLILGAVLVGVFQASVIF